MTFSQKQMSVAFSLANGNFGTSKNNTATIAGLRMSAQIQATGGASQSHMSLAIFGLPLSLMNQLSTVGSQVNQRSQNNVTLSAGDVNGGMTLVFDGVIFNAFVDAQQMPQVAFRIMANPTAYYAVKPATPLSIRGGADVAGMLSGLAGQMGLAFENNGVNVKLSSPYFGGSPLTQAQAIVRHAGIVMTIERGTMAITPRGVPRQGDAVVVSPQTGLDGYPAFVENALILRTLFNPAIKTNGLIEVQSDLKPACGNWQVGSVFHELECQQPHGKWFTTIQANPIGTQ